MIRLLMITYYWPPLGGPGSIRPVKFAKYLPQFDIEPTILTRKPIAYHSMDALLEEDAPHLKIIRTESLDPARLCYLLGMRSYHPKEWQIPIKKVLNFPDSKFPWIPFAYQAGVKTSFDCIFVTAPPFSSFIAAYMLAKKTNKPLLLDFRDAWLEFPFMRYDTEPEKKFVLYWERKTVSAASFVIVVDENINDMLCKKYPFLVEKIQVIPNGYDPDDFYVNETPKTFTISYLGTVRKERDPENFLKALSELHEEGKLKHGDVRVKFIGHVEDRYLHVMKRYPFVSILGHLPYRQALQEFSSAHISLMITSGDEFFFPSRQNEYLAAGLPIIVCGKSKGIHRLESAISQGYPGWIFDFTDTVSMKQRIMTQFTSFKKGEIRRAETPYKEYTRQNLTGILSHLIKKVCENNKFTGQTSIKARRR